MNAFLIVVGIYIAIVVNWIRWSRSGSELRGGCYIFSFFVGVILIIISICADFSTEKTKIDNPKFLEYSSFGKTNYLMYRFKEEDPATLIWLGDLEQEKQKKFYSVKYKNFFGSQNRETIERY